MLLDLIAGARPNFMKIAPIIRALDARRSSGRSALEYRLIHTGQHYDRLMSEVFFSQLGIPEPSINLGVGSGTQARQTADIMMRYEDVLKERSPELCLVVGDVTSTLACSIIARKQGVRVAHVEGGLRSGDLEMPEEINRIVTDSISDLFFTTSEHANRNLRNAGVPAERIHFVGNTMIDTLLFNLDKLRPPGELADGCVPGCYLVLTLHRPGNVDDPGRLASLLDAVLRHSGDDAILFPVHPRTAKNLERIGSLPSRLLLLSPQPYLEFNWLVKRARAVITDSGGITEETTVMGVPCMTLRSTTERPETVEIGTNVLIDTDLSKLERALRTLFAGNWKKGAIPEKWDGKAGARIIDILEDMAQNNFEVLRDLERARLRNSAAIGQ